MTTLKALSQDEKARMFAKAREDAARMNYEAHCVSREQGLEAGREAGLKEGREKGREEGLLQGETQALLRLLAKRFGELPESIRESIEGAPLQELRSWFNLALDASTLDDVFAPNDAS